MWPEFCRDYPRSAVVSLVVSWVVLPAVAWEVWNHDYDYNEKDDDYYYNYQCTAIATATATAAYFYHHTTTSVGPLAVFGQPCKHTWHASFRHPALKSPGPAPKHAATGHGGEGQRASSRGLGQGSGFRP